MIFYLGAILTIAITTSVSAQRTVTGRIVDKETGKPIKDVQVIQLGTNFTTTSNALGFFQLQVDSIATIEIESSDYQPVQIEIPNVNTFKVELEKALPDSTSTEEIFPVIEEMASFPGGMPIFYAYVSKNMKTPKEVRNGKISGRVMVQFVIDKNGQIPPDSIKVTKGLCTACDEEAIRLIKGSPNWNPGTQKGKPVRQRWVLPIRFE